jgi:hypothetical protein
MAVSDINLDFTGLGVALLIGVLAAWLATPLLWRLGAGLSRARRAVLAVLAALGLAGAAAAWFAYALRDDELASFAIVFTLTLQLPVLPLLLFLARPSRTG